MPNAYQQALNQPHVNFAVNSSGSHDAEHESLRASLSEWHKLPCHQKAWTILRGLGRLSFTWMWSVRDHLAALRLYHRVRALRHTD
jgi:hypothetical protein